MNRPLCLGFTLIFLGCQTSSRSSLPPPEYEPAATATFTTPSPAEPTAAASGLSSVAAPEPSASEPPAAATTAAETASAPAPASASAPAGLRITDLRIGGGRAVRSGDTVKVIYVGKLPNGSVFDQSRDTPIRLGIGKNQLIEGWERGLLGMRVGGRRRLIIPPDLAYGDRGSPPKIPPRATLTFEIDLLAVE